QKYLSLTTLQLDATEVSDETLKLFANPNLINLSLIRCEEISDAALTFLAATCPKLRSLKLAGTKATLVTDKALGEFAQQCPNLQLPLDIDVERLKQLPHQLWHDQWRGYNAFRRDMMRKAFVHIMKDYHEPPPLPVLGIKNRQQLYNFLKEYSKELKDINLKECEYLEDEDISFLAEAMPNIEFLYLKDCRRLTDASLNKVSEKWGSLTRLYLSNCPQISVDAILDFVTHHPKLRTFCCPNVTFNDLLILAKACPELKNILITNENGSSEECKIFKFKLFEINRNIVISRTSMI
ncbi:MAG: hypothetical protein LLG04_15935, partial [Parachlamydia sp.]|nr:hypothetical protein [Parachlamydia sp.]